MRKDEGKMKGVKERTRQLRGARKQEGEKRRNEQRKVERERKKRR